MSSLRRVRVTANYPPGQAPSGSALTAAATMDATDRVFMAYDHPDPSQKGMVRVIAPADSHQATGFYPMSGDPKGYIGWNVEARYIEELEPVEDSPLATMKAKIQKEPGTGIPTEIRCHQNMGVGDDSDDDRCRNEASWNVHLKTPNCGRSDRRGNNHRYCDDHFIQFLRKMTEGRHHHCLQEDCDGDHVMFWNDYLSSEKL